MPTMLAAQHEAVQGSSAGRPSGASRSAVADAADSLRRKTTGMSTTETTRKTISTERSRPTPPTRTGGSNRRTGRSTGSQMAESTCLDLANR